MNRSKRFWTLFHGVLLSILTAVVFYRARPTKFFEHSDALVSDSEEFLSAPKFTGAIPPDEDSVLCPQTKPLNPTKHHELEQKIGEVLADKTYKLESYQRLSGAIQIPYVLPAARPYDAS